MRSSVTPARTPCSARASWTARHARLVALVTASLLASSACRDQERAGGDDHAARIASAKLSDVGYKYVDDFNRWAAAQRLIGPSPWLVAKRFSHGDMFISVSRQSAASIDVLSWSVPLRWATDAERGLPAVSHAGPVDVTAAEPWRAALLLATYRVHVKEIGEFDRWKAPLVEGETGGVGSHASQPTYYVIQPETGSQVRKRDDFNGVLHRVGDDTRPSDLIAVAVVGLLVESESAASKGPRAAINVTEVATQVSHVLAEVAAQDSPGREDEDAARAVTALVFSEFECMRSAEAFERVMSALRRVGGPGSLLESERHLVSEIRAVLYQGRSATHSVLLERALSDDKAVRPAVVYAVARDWLRVDPSEAKRGLRGVARNSNRTAAAVRAAAIRALDEAD